MENRLASAPASRDLAAMRSAPRPLLLLAAALCAGLPWTRAADPAKVDPAQQVEKYAPGPDTAKPVEKVLEKRADRVQDARAAIAGLIDEPTAPLAERRSPIDMAEAREKKIVERKDAPLATTPIEHKDSPLNGQAARDRFQSADNAYRGGGSAAEKYRQGLRDADAASVKFQPDLGRQTTFDQLNRFVYKRNGPGTEGGAALVTAAGGGAATQVPVATADAASAPPVTGTGGGLGFLFIGAPAAKPPSASAMDKFRTQFGEPGAVPVLPASPTGK